MILSGEGKRKGGSKKVAAKQCNLERKDELGHHVQDEKERALVASLESEESRKDLSRK